MFNVFKFLNIKTIWMEMMTLLLLVMRLDPLGALQLVGIVASSYVLHAKPCLWKMSQKTK